MADVVGRMFHEFAVTLAVAIAISLVVSPTLTPMMCARMLREPLQSEDGAPGAMDRFIARYGEMLDWVLARQPAAMMAMLATILLTVLLYFCGR